MIKSKLIFKHIFQKILKNIEKFIIKELLHNHYNGKII